MGAIFVPVQLCRLLTVSENCNSMLKVLYNQGLECTERDKQQHNLPHEEVSPSHFFAM